MRQLIGFLTLAALAGCVGPDAAEGGERLPVEVLAVGGQCAALGEQPSLRYFTETEALGRALAQALAGLPAVPALRPEEAAVLVGMGLKPTGGYRLELAEPCMSVAEGVARLRLEWREPPADAMVTQALTYPCIALKVPRRDYREIRIEDQAGDVRLRWIKSH
jgi:hypothetical protein